MVWQEVVWQEVVWQEVVWQEVVWQEVVWQEVVWQEVVWLGSVMWWEQSGLSIAGKVVQGAGGVQAGRWRTEHALTTHAPQRQHMHSQGPCPSVRLSTSQSDYGSNSKQQDS